MRDKQHPSLISVKENLRFKFESLPKDHLHQYKVILEGNLLVGSDLLEDHLDKYKVYVEGSLLVGSDRSRQEANSTFLPQDRADVVRSLFFTIIWRALF